MPWSKNFDVDEALQRAGQTFWDRGYQATSMRDLLEAMGIQKGSFYDTYGSKQEAYLSSLQSFVDTRLSGFAEAQETASPRAALETMFRDIYKECIGAEGHRGCMVINCALELAHQDPEAREVVQAAFRTHEKLIQGWLQDAQATGDISSTLDPRATTKALMAFIMGMRVYARAGSPKSTIKTLLDQALALIDG